MILVKDIPLEFKHTFKELLENFPEEQRENIELQKKIAAFLKLGGIRMARQCVKAINLQFKSKLDIRRRGFDDEFYDPEDFEDAEEDEHTIASDSPGRGSFSDDYSI